MAQSKSSTVYERIDGIKSFFSTFLGVIVAVIGMAVVFVVSSLDGTKEIKAPNKESAIIMAEWRENNPGKDFPENKIDTFKYEDKEYYFVIDSYNEDGSINEWYFAYEGGIGYIFTDMKFYILTAFVMFVTIFVSQINYTTAINSTMETTKFVNTLLAYQDSKEKISDYTHYIPPFCNYKNKQLYEEIKRDIVESADINYDFYKSNKFDITKVEKWQLKILKKIKHIKIARISASDLLQEQSNIKTRRSLLPASKEASKKKYLFSTILTRTLTSILTGMTVALGVVLGDWFLGLTYGFSVFLSFITSNISGCDYANNGLRQRFIAKTDILNEFYNVKDNYIKKEENNE